MLCGVPRWQPRGTPIDVLTRASAYGDALLAALHRKADEVIDSDDCKAQTALFPEGVFRAREERRGATLSLLRALASMSHARQPFSRGAVVTGVKAKRSAVKHPPELNRSVDTRRVKWDIVKPWIASRVTELLTVEDDVLIAMIYNLLEQDQVHKNGVYVYSQLQTFLEKDTDVFMRELWDMLVSANANPSGIPQKFIDEKAAELRRQKAVADELRRRQRESDDAARRQRVKLEVKPEFKPEVKPERGEEQDRGEGRSPRRDRDDDRSRRRRDDSWERRYRSRSRSRSPRARSRDRRERDDRHDRPARGRSRD